MAVLSEPFQAQYLEWFRRLRLQAVDDTEVPAIRDAAVGELAALQDRYRADRISEAGFAYGREQIRGLLERVIGQRAMSTTTKTELRRLVAASLQPRLLDGAGRYTQDWFSHHEDHWMQHFGHLAGRPGLQAVEVGSYEGRSASWLIQNLLTGEGSRLVCVDPFEQYEGQERNFDHNIGLAAGHHKVLKLRGRSHQVLPFLAERSFDFIYVDGSHLVLDVLQDAAMCWQLLRPGGVIVFDDYEHTLFPDEFGMSAGPAIRAFLPLIRDEHQLLFQDWQVGVRKTDDAAAAGVTD
ncbi:class I SAM-dependent methyltransferase [Modestobacter sp. VKM Ac-2981]|nr:class I SAM-dependent methyltransferase [Modestobacter sp. VKM Ac-2981]MCZ2826098.1 class I SAM-dependent methyltransferase [Modestobacter sp. VKM Ac-2981]